MFPHLMASLLSHAHMLAGLYCHAMASYEHAGDYAYELGSRRGAHVCLPQGAHRWENVWTLGERVDSGRTCGLRENVWTPGERVDSATYGGS